MVRIRQRQDRHFMDDEGRMFWINGPEEFCYLSEQRQWRGRAFRFNRSWNGSNVRLPDWSVQRFSSILAACEAFEHNQVIWSRGSLSPPHG